jgi:hypothetical protein
MGKIPRIEDSLRDRLIDGFIARFRRQQPAHCPAMPGDDITCPLLNARHHIRRVPLEITDAERIVRRILPHDAQPNRMSDNAVASGPVNPGRPRVN